MAARGGLSVVEQSGWQTRARSSGGYASGRPVCVMWHHTASRTSPQNDANYMSLNSSSRPIANLMVTRDGQVWVLAAGATNTNGQGNSMRFSRGTVPANSMNTWAVGMEICNAGTGVEPYSQAQIDAAFAASIAICAGLGLRPDDVAGHWDYAPTRKIDPAPASAVQGPWRPRETARALVAGRSARQCNRRVQRRPVPTSPSPNPNPNRTEEDYRPTPVLAATAPSDWCPERRRHDVHVVTSGDDAAAYRYPASRS